MARKVVMPMGNLAFRFSAQLLCYLFYYIEHIAQFLLVERSSTPTEQVRSSGNFCRGTRFQSLQDYTGYPHSGVPCFFVCSSVRQAPANRVHFIKGLDEGEWSATRLFRLTPGEIAPGTHCTGG
jgi:hypothetical protein